MIDLQKYNYIFLKLSGLALKDQKSNNFFDNDYINQLSIVLKKIVSNKNSNHKFIIVIGGGNIWRGEYAKNEIDNYASDYMGILATNINAIYLKEKMIENNLKVDVLSSLKIENIFEKFNVEKAHEILQNNDILLLSSGTGKPGVTTDSGIIKFAYLLNAKIILFGKNNVDGIYTDDPKVNPHAKKIDELKYDYLIKNKIKIIDEMAAIKSKEYNIISIFFNINNPENIYMLWDKKFKNYSIVKK